MQKTLKEAKSFSDDEEHGFKGGGLGRARFVPHHTLIWSQTAGCEIVVHDNLDNPTTLLLVLHYIYGH